MLSFKVQCNSKYLGGNLDLLADNEWYHLVYLFDFRFVVITLQNPSITFPLRQNSKIL